MQGDEQAQPQQGQPQQGQAQRQKPAFTTVTVQGESQAQAVTRVKTDGDGLVSVELQDGRTVDADDTSMTEDEKYLAQQSTSMDPDAVDDMMRRYEPGQESRPYFAGFKRIYNAAKNGETLENIHSLYAKAGMTEAQRQAAWEAGRRAWEAGQRQAAQTNRKAAEKWKFQTLEEGESRKSQVGVIFGGVTKVSDSQGKQLQIIDEFAKVHGLQVRVYDSLGRENGHYDSGSNIIHLGLDADQGALTRTVSHEGYHFLQSYNQEAAEKLQHQVIDILRNTEGYDLDGRIREKMDLYRKNGVKLTEQQALDEITADSMLDVLGSEENMKRLMQVQDAGMMAKIREWISKTLAELQQIMRRYAKGSPEARALMPQVEQLQKMQTMYLDAFDQATQNYRQAQEGATESARENSFVKEYMQDMQGGEDAQTALNALVSQLFFQSQQAWMQQHMDADMDEALQRFADALKEYRTEQKALSTVLEAAGFAAPGNGDMNTALSYAADQLVALEERTGEEARVQYSAKEESVYDYTKPFSEQVDDWLQKRIPSDNMLFVGGTPLVFQQVGFSALPMTIDQEHVSYAIMGKEEALDDHNLGVEILKQLPELMEKPVAIIQSETRSDDSVVAIVKATINGKQVMAAVNVGGTGMFNGKYNNVNEITTTQGRENTLSKLLADAIEVENQGGIGVFYINKTEARSLKASSGVQFPDTALQDGLNHSIFDVGSPVKREYLEQTGTWQFKRWFGNSKVTENGKAKGKPKVVYHGAAEEFSIFDKRKQGRNFADSSGFFFFTSKKTAAENYSRIAGGDNGKVIEAYLRLEKPYVIYAPASISPTEYYDMNSADIFSEVVANDYDGFIIKGRGDYEGEENYGVVEPNQIKSATGNKGTFSLDNDDIYYSMKDTGDTDLDMKDEDVTAGVEDDAEFFAQVGEDQDARDALGLLHKLDESTNELTRGQWENRLGETADKLIGTAESKYGRVKLMQELRTLYEAMDDNRIDVGEKAMYAREIAKHLIENAVTQGDMDETMQEVRRVLKNTPFYLTDDMRSELNNARDGVGAYTRKNFGTMRIRKEGTKGAMSLSDLWVELNGIAPGTFTLDATEADMPIILDAYLENGKKVASSFYGGSEAGFATDLAYQMMLDYYDVPGALKKSQDIRKEFRQKLENFRQNFLQKQEEKLKTSRERAEATKRKQTLRNQIGQAVRYMNTRIVGQTDVRHVPEGLRGAAEAMVQPFLERTGVFKGADLERLRREYALLAENGQNHGIDAARAYDADIEEKIDTLTRTLEGRRLAELTENELQDVKDIVGNLKKMITEANEMQVQGRKTTLETEGEAFIQEMQRRHRIKNEALRKIEDLTYKNMTPVYYADKVGGVVKDMIADLREGQNQWAFNFKNAKARFNEIAKKYSLNDWINDKDTLKFDTQRGEHIELDRDLAMSLYATWKRETTNTRQNANHLRIGGFMYQQTKENRQLEGVDTYAPHALTAADMQVIMDYLGKDQMQFVDEMVDYLSHDMAKLGNEMSMKLYGYEKFGEKYYYPYSSDRNFLTTELTDTSETSTGSIKNSGMTKATVRNASNPIVVDGFLKTWANHVNQMCLYNAFAETTDNLNRLYNYRTAGVTMLDSATGNEDVIAPRSLKLEMEKALGKEAVKYLQTLVKDVNGGVRNDDRTGTGKMLSLFKKGSVAANASVVVQQPSAIMRAMNMVNPKYFLKINPAKTAQNIKEMEQYSGVAIIKDMGRFDTGTGLGATEWLLDDVKEESLLKRAYGVMDEWTGKGAELADKITWAALWQACKNEVAGKMPGIEADTEQYMRAVAQRFNDVCDHTQVYDSVLSKSDAMRSTALFDKITTSFMAEPTVSYNMLLQGLQNIRTPGGKAKATRAMASFAAACALNAMLKSLVTAGRRKDDDDRTYIEKYLGEVVENFGDDMSVEGIISLVPIARDAVSIFQGYDVNRSDMDVIEQFHNAYKTVANESKTLEDKLKAIAGAMGQATGVPVKNILRDIDGMMNIMRSAPMGETSGRDIKYTVLDSLSGAPWSLLWDSGKKAYYDRIEQAMAQGNKEQADELWGYMVETNGVKEDAVKKGVKDEIKESMAKGLMSREKAESIMQEYFHMDENDAFYAVEKWAQEAEHAEGEAYSYSTYKEVASIAREGGDITEAAKKLTEHGKTDKDVQGAIKSAIKDAYVAGDMDRSTAESRIGQYIKTMDQNDRYWLMDEWDYLKENPGEKYTKYGRAWAAVDSGSGSQMRAEMKRLMDHGVKKNSIASQITTQYKKQYVSLYKTDRSRAADMKARILNAYEALGYDREKKNKDIEKWLEEK